MDSTYYAAREIEQETLNGLEEKIKMRKKIRMKDI